MIFQHIPMLFFQMLLQTGMANAVSAVAARPHHPLITAGGTAIFLVHIAHVTLIIFTEASSAVNTEVILIVGILDTHAKLTLCILSAAIFAQSAGFAYIGAVITVRCAFFTNDRTLRTVSASKTNFITGAAVVAVFAPKTGRTARTDAAVFAEGVTVAKLARLAALGTELYTVITSLTAVLANNGAIVTQLAILTEAVCIQCTFLTHSAIGAVGFPIAGGAVAAAVGTDFDASFTAFTAAVAKCRAFSADAAGLTPTVYTACTVIADTAVGAHTAGRFRTIAANTAFGAKFRTVFTDLTASKAERGAIQTAASTGTNGHAVTADVAIITPAVIAYTSLAQSAVGTQCARTVGALLGTVLADIGTVGTSCAANTEGRHTVSADVAIITPSVIAYASLALAAVGTQISRTVGALLGTVLADIGTVDTSTAANADGCHTVTATVTVIAPAVLYTAFLAGVAIAAEIIITVITVLCAFRAHKRTRGTAVSAGTHVIGASVTCLTVAAVKVFSSDTVNTGIASAADILIGTICAFFKAILANRRTFRAPVSAIADAFYAVAAVVAFKAPAV